MSPMPTQSPSRSVNDDLRSPEAQAEPHAFLRRLREHDPVHWSAPNRAWVITSHAEVSAAFLDRELSSDRLTPLEARMSDEGRERMKETFDLLRGWMVFRDPPVHTRLRDTVRQAFTPRAMAALAPRIQAVIDDLLDGLDGRDEIELIESFAFPLPAIVIAEQLGVPVEDREQFKTWSTKLGGLVFGAVEVPDRRELASEGAAEFTEYFTRLIRQYEAAPGDNLISALIAARDRGDSIPDELMVGACTLLLFGGHETTTGLIANGMTRLLEHPDQVAMLRADPGLLEPAIEECLRYEGPAHTMVRLVQHEHERGGHTLRPGDRVYLSMAAANRDPDVFEEPDRFDITRQPNPHLGFGHGLHFCLGAPLARLETRLAFSALLKRYPNLRLATDDLTWGSTIIGRRVATVPLRLR